MLQHGKELGLLADILNGLADVLVGVIASCLDSNLISYPHSSIYFPEAPYANDFLQNKLWEVDLQD